MKTFILAWLILTASVFAQSQSVRYNTTTKVLISPTATEFKTANSIQPLDADLTSIAGLTTTAFGRGLLDDANAAAILATIGAEPALGNPGTDGHALVSTIAGIRSWAPVGSAFGSQAANLVFSGPASGAAAAPTFRLLQEEDFPAEFTHELIDDDANDAALWWNDNGGESGTGSIEKMTLSAGEGLSSTGVHTIKQTLQYAASDLATAITAGVTKAYIPIPFTCTATAARANLLTRSTSGAVTIDLMEDATDDGDLDNGVTILSTQITIDVSERSSRTAAIPPVISDTTLTAGNYLVVDIIGAGTGAKGLIIEVDTER